MLVLRAEGLSLGGLMQVVVDKGSCYLYKHRSTSASLKVSETGGFIGS